MCPYSGFQHANAFISGGSESGFPNSFQKRCSNQERLQGFESGLGIRRYPAQQLHAIQGQVSQLYTKFG